MTVISSKAYLRKRRARSELPSNNTSKDAVMSDKKNSFRLPSMPSFRARLLGSLPFTSSQSSIHLDKPAQSEAFDSTDADSVKGTSRWFRQGFAMLYSSSACHADPPPWI